MAHHLGEPYSDKNPIPKITTGLRALVSPQKATEAKARQMQQDAGTANDEQLTKDDRRRTEDMELGRRVLVRDPTTGSDVYIQNAKDDVPQGDNVLKLPLPQPDWDAHRDQVVAIAVESLWTLAAIFAVSILATAYLAPRWWILYPFVLASALVSTLTFINKIRNTAIDDADARFWHSERIRGLRAGRDYDGDGDVETEERMRESAEWANSLLAGVWPIMNPSLFDSIVDMLEDIMQASMPKFVHSVRISDMGLGRVPLRIISVRALPDSSNEQALHKLDEEDREQLTGDHINLEISFAYRAAPSTPSTSSKAQNIHLLIDFFVGMEEIWGFKLPIWVEVKGIVGTARLRLQLIPDPPFIKTTLFTLLGLPHIKPSVVAMSRAMPNVMNLPVISGFISSALDTAAAEYVAPKSLILDVQQLLGGSGVAKDTQALGVLIIHIHRAVGLKGMDNSGRSDAYVTLTLSRVGKSLFSTRIVKQDLNPVFEETAALLIDLNVVKLDEKLSIQLWDSDRSSADDMMGFVDVDILDFIRDKNKAHRRMAHLASPDSRGRPGLVEFTLGYYAKVPPNPKARKSGSPEEIGRDPGLPEDLNIEDTDRAAEDRSAIGDIEKSVLRCPPDDDWVTGILGIQVHEIRDLGIGRGGRAGDKPNDWSFGVKHKAKEIAGMVQEGVKGSDTQGEDEESEDLPSSYCTISLNDDLIYKTRAKPITSTPIFNAGTERFLKDWRTAHVGVRVMDSRMRENDAVLGIVFVKLSDVFKNSSQLTRVFHLEHGIGHGRIRISLLFRSIAAQLPLTLRGFDSVTAHIRAVRAKDIKLEGLANSELRIKATTSSSESKVTRRPRIDDGALVWEDNVTEIPVQQRYATALTFAFKPGGIHRGKTAMSVIWLRDVADFTPGVLSVPLWTGRDGGFARLKQNYIPMDGNLSAWDSDQEKLSRIGSLEVDLELIPGIGSRSRKRMGSDESKRQLGEEIEREERDHVRDDVGRSPTYEDSSREPRTSDTAVSCSESDAALGSSPTKIAPDSTTATDGHSTGTRLAETRPDSTTTTVEQSSTKRQESMSMVASTAATSQESLGKVQSTTAPSLAGTRLGTQSTDISTTATVGHGSQQSSPLVRSIISRSADSTDGTIGHEGAKYEEVGNILVSAGAVEVKRADGTSSSGNDSWVRGEHDPAQGESSNGEEGESTSKGPIEKIKAWKQNQRELGADHRGIMQAKPARTAVWVKDKVEHGVHSFKDRFALDARQPNVETEV